jgi:acyl transferase domain-containing protein
VEAFWRVIRDGVETTADYPGGRFPEIDGIYAAKEGIATARGGFLAAVDGFDAEFFGIAPREAALLDPQQRLLLEVAWEAIEDAGIPTARIAGSETGVFVGLWTSDYESCVYERLTGPDFYATTGGGRYPASGRLAYFFDLRGPNLTVDTACSSSLVAIHLACQSLRQGDSEMALAGGANVILRTEVTTAYAAANMLSADGRSKFGDASADGYVRSEGAGLVLLKPLARALADGDPIYAVIRGSAVNNDGHSSGLLISPSRAGQEALLRKAFRDANLNPGAIDYIEAHGTGTLVGDPVEIESIGRVVATPERQHPCAIGSVKTNIGHTESAAGVAGLIKVALSLQRGILPASLHFQEPNPAIAWDTLPIAIQRATAPWPHDQPVRIAGVSGFGITGTNAHVVLENFETSARQSATAAEDLLFVLSAHSAKSLAALAASWRERLQSDPAWPESLADLAYTAAVRRTHQDHRLTVIAASRQQLLDRISGWLDGQPAEGVRAGRRTANESPKVAFVFPGQGGQWSGMAKALLPEPVFRDTLTRCDEAIRRLTGWSVIDRIMAEDAEMPDDVSVVQPCLFAVMVSLAALWRSWGVEPQAVVGHSMGECAAAAACGALSIEDAAAVVCHRSSLMKRVSGRGLMAFAGLSLEQATALADEYAGRLSVAANNSPGSTVLSGEPAAIEDALRRLTEREVFCRRIKVDVASHCSQMDPLLPELEARLNGIKPRVGQAPLYSTSSGTIEDGSRLDAEYWGRNLRQPVLFSGAVNNLLRDGFDTFVEINAHPVLSQAIESSIGDSGKNATVVASLRRGRNDRAEMLSALGALYVSGYPLDFRRLYSHGVCLRLPAAVWNRERYWIEMDGAPRQPRRPAVAPVAASDPAKDIYELQWREAAMPPAANAIGLWIVIGGSGTVATPLISLMESAGGECVRVGNVEELERALEAVGRRRRGVIRISAMQSSDAHDAAAESMDIVRTVRAVAGAADAPRLWLVTTGVWHLASDGGEVHVAQSPAWGLGRVIEREHPELRSVNADLSASPDDKEIEFLGRLICGDGSEEQIAIRGEKYLVARYRRMAQETGGAVAFRADAAYLITGGLGGIGLHLAEWLVKNGARHIALVGRRQPDDAARERISALESMGAAVRVVSADMADDDQVRAMMASLDAELPPLKGLFHLAAAYESALLGDVEPTGLERVMRSKADGVWALDRRLNGLDLDYFVLFSSIAAAISQPGLGSYAAANAYAEGLARSRRARGLKAQSVQWGSWASTGLSKDRHVQDGVRVYQQMGIQPIAVEDALRALANIMVAGTTDVLVAPISWDQFARSFANAAPPRAFLDLLPKAEIARAPETPEAIGEGLLALEPARRRAALEAHLRERLAAVLKTDAARIDPAKPFGAMGMDSLMGLEFVRRLSAITGLRLPVTAVFNYPTIQTFASEIARRMSIALETAAPAEVRPNATAMRSAGSSVDGMTDDEAIEALMCGGPRAV